MRVSDPARALERARETWKKHGRSDKWIQQRMTGERFTEPLVRLYDALARFAPTTGVLVARAVAHAENGNPATALAQLDQIPDAASYQPFWAARARVSWLSGDEQAAWTSARTAAGLSNDSGVRAFLLAGGFRGGDR